MNQPTAQEIEHVARRLCEARGFPDELWTELKDEARDAIVTHRAVQELTAA